MNAPRRALTPDRMSTRPAVTPMPTPTPELPALASKDLTTLLDLSPADMRLLLSTAATLKAEPRLFAQALAGLSIVLLFEKASLRTRLTFEVGAARLGGHAVYYDHSKERIGQREATKDYARNLERWVHAIVARTFSQRTIEELARYSRVPVINALSDEHHPCQALADVLTLSERFGALPGLRLAYVGDGNNVCVSLMHAAALLGLHMRVITPPGFEPPARAVDESVALAAESRGSLRLANDLALLSADGGADAVYTDTWVSMHQEAEADAREAAFVPFRVDAALMARAAPHAVFMHCLPAHRGEEVTDEVIDAPASLVYEQAENRLHAQNALLVHAVAARRGRAAPPSAAPRLA